VSNLWLYGIAGLGLVVSYSKDRQKTRQSLLKAWKSLENILPEFLAVILFVGLMLAALQPEVITRIIGAGSGWAGVLLASVVGAITLIPGFIAFPTAAMLLRGGAGYMQIAAFISSLMMVGVITLPIESRYFGKKLAYARNITAFIFSIIIALIVGMVVTQTL
jgi:uncharacterized membrane protein YraQ (UPF0718 family)